MGGGRGRFENGQILDGLYAVYVLVLAGLLSLFPVSQRLAGGSANAKKLGEQLSQVGGATNTVTAETGKLTAVQKAAAESSGAKAGEWDKYIAKLTETRDLIGANSAAEAEYNAVKMGASVEQRTQYVMSADAVRMFGTGVLDQMNAGLIPAFATGGGIGESGEASVTAARSRI